MNKHGPPTAKFEEPHSFPGRCPKCQSHLVEGLGLTAVTTPDAGRYVYCENAYCDFFMQQKKGEVNV